MKKIAAVLVALAIAGGAAAGEFKYSIPPGWRDLPATIQQGPNFQDISQIPGNMLTDAASGKFAVYAIDPANTTEKKPGATFNAVETPAKGRMTEQAVDSYAAELVAQMRAAGLTGGLVESSLISMNGVDVGTVTMDMDSEQGGSRRLIQYLIPGRTGSTVLTYAAPKDEFARYLPVFRASVRATQGGHAAGGFNWTRTLVVALLAGIAGGIFTYVKGRGGARAEAPAADEADSPVVKTPAPASTKAKSYVWTCPGCGKPVPLRIDQCRCGTAKPA